MLVTHRGSMDVCTRHLLGKKPRSRKEFKTLVEKVPFCALSCCVEDSKWKMVEPPVGGFTHRANGAYDWKIWL